MRRVVSVAGVPVGLTAAHTWTPVIDALFGGCPATDEPAVVEIDVDAPPVRPTRPADLAEDDYVSLWFDDDGVVVFDRLGIGAQATGTTIRAGGEGGDPRSWRLVVQYALIDVLARLGHHAVHGAAFVRDGTAVLALGEGGAGKSTLAYAAWRQGWQVLSDDIVWLHGDPAPTAAGFPKPLAVPAELMVGAPPEGSHAIEGDARGRWVLPFDAVAVGPARPLVGIVIVGHGTDGAELEPVDGGPALLSAVLRAHPLAPAGRVARDFFALAAATSRLPTMRLRHHPDPARRAAEAGRLLDEALARFLGAAQ